ncbi:MAG: DUF4358 domain-containing protein [Firmicutes bacterium]|nr:DUF4358 domain-containing protein [Bacillota bacterium]MBR6684299.1 DUF4358 domain-containing protein [Bacillota bacterium]
MKNMKRFIAVVCAMLLAIGVIGCGNSQNDEAKEIELSKVHQEIKDAYGETYLATMDYDSQILETVFGVNPDWVEEFIAQGPMMSAHVDTFIAIKATEGNVENVKKALEDYRQMNIENNMFYPMNLPKLETAEVYQTGEYVFYIMLGGYTDVEDESGAKEFYTEQNQIAIDIIEKQ